MRLKERNCLHNRRVQSEEASADVEAAASYPEDLVNIIHKGGYTEQQMFNVGEPPLCCKKITCMTFIAREEKSVALLSTMKICCLV